MPPAFHGWGFVMLFAVLKQNLPKSAGKWPFITKPGRWQPTASIFYWAVCCCNKQKLLMRGFCREAMIYLGAWKYENGYLYCSLLPCLCGTIVLNCNFSVEGILHFFPHPAGEIYCCNVVSPSKKLSRSSWSGDSRNGSFKLWDAADYNFCWSQEGPYDFFYFPLNYYQCGLK